MFDNQLAAAVTAATTYTAINAVSAALWKAHGAGLIDDAAAQAAAEALECRKQAIGGGSAKTAPMAFSGISRRHTPRSPDKDASLRRRRSCAASGAVPAVLAHHYTQAELAALSAVAAEVRRSGTCDWPVDRIAACAGVCRRVVQYALRRAAALGHLHVEERPRPGQKHLPSRITVTAPEWRSWLRLADRVQKPAHHGNPVYSKHHSLAGERQEHHNLSNDKKPLRGGMPTTSARAFPNAVQRNFAHKKAAGKAATSL